jgi:hypothetical protein
MIRKSCIGMFFCIALTAYGRPACADINEVQKLSFGKWAVTNNNSIRTITLGTDGNYTNSPSMVMINPPQVGIYNIDGLPPGTSFPSVNVTMTQQMRGAGGPAFTVDNFTTLIPATNGAGETTLTLGATAKTSGNGQGYPDDTYEGELNIDLNL